MAREIRVILTDDLDGTAATQTVEFSIAGNAYSIDLNDANVAKLEAALKPFIDNAEKVRGARQGGARRQPGRVTRGGTTAIRAWARENGHKVSDRGRIPAEVLAAYEAAN
ncbi:Lsr2 family protein [Tessaracoccus sp. HDW20]|uniref:histone-like nucleoid-structuring protein Lsr2 n=1 Tax=Tessaracoccus coleopterorum TaxID=2714950 RepID=UPI0018D4CA4A|nr:Lsr2 family protein [Tessaracoccus coleopterorum]NHB85456.1 Lsr2 family protein [Tessaracoccus coleopterorum]